MSSCSEPRKSRSSRSSCTMQKNAAALTIVCIMMCFTFNYTFPLHRKTSLDESEGYYVINSTVKCDVPTHRETIAERSKKMASNIGNAILKFKDSTQDLGRNIYDHMSSGLWGSAKRILNEDDLRQYEQMVIMKKYPYLDLNDIQKFSPSKHVRQSVKYEQGPNPNTQGEPSICEPAEELPNVEIINRGLTGFAIPPELSKHVAVGVDKPKDNNFNPPNDDNEGFEKLEKKSSIKEMLGSLKNEIKEYVDKKGKE